MKRVRSFKIRICAADPAFGENRFEPSQDCIATEGWHNTCQEVVARLVAARSNCSEDSPHALEAQVFDSVTNRLLARFSEHNLELLAGANVDETGEQLLETRVWETVDFLLDENCKLNENRNVRDFQWELLDGAKRAVPFRLNYLERQAETNSMWAYGLGLLQEVRDLLVRRH